jgi:hypothetical protein
VIEVRVSGYGQREPLRLDPERIHIRKDRLLRCVGDSSIYQDDAVADEEILEEVSASKQGLNLMNTWVKFHGCLQT